MKYKFKIIFLATIILAIAGCSTARTYTGEQKPLEKISVLKGAWNIHVFSQVFGTVVNVDGNDVSGKDKVELLPGKHEVSVGLVYMPLTGQQVRGKAQKFNIVTEAGHVYIVDGNWNDGNNQIWIEDENTGKIIAGRKPN